MNGDAGMTCEVLAALIDRALKDEARTTPPPAADEQNWLYGAGLTDPEGHGWMAPAPPMRVWSPRALAFWCTAVRAGAAVSQRQRDDPRHSLEQWPAIAAAVNALVQARSVGRERRPGQCR